MRRRQCDILERLQLRFFKYVLSVNKFTSSMMVYDIKVFKHSVKMRLKDQFIQKWHEIISQGGKCTVYRIIKTSLCFESYLNELPDLHLKYFTKFRCRNHCFLIEAGVRSQLLRDIRICQFCETDIGDEFYYLLCCPNFKEERKHFINLKYELFKQTKGEHLKKLAMFVKIIIGKF